jgi:hypothetical protein
MCRFSQKRHKKHMESVAKCQKITPVFLSGTNGNGNGRGIIAFESQHAKAPNQVRTDFEAFPNGTFVELIESSTQPHRTQFAVYESGEVRYENALDYGGLTYLPTELGDNPILQTVRLPSRAQPYDSEGSLLQKIWDLIARCVRMEERELLFVTHFVLCTWVTDRLRLAPYLAVIGLQQSGKSTLLQVLALICRRAILVAGDPEPFYSISPSLHLTLLLDEPEKAYSPRFRRLLRAGDMPNVVEVKGRKILRPFGAKVLSWLEPPDDLALNSRCVQIQMREVRQKLEKPADAAVQQAADELRAHLLQFRFEHYHQIHLADVPDLDRLRPRSRDLARIFAAPVSDDPRLCAQLSQVFRDRERSSREALPPDQNAILLTLFSQIHQKNFEGLVSIRNLTEQVNHNLKACGERLRLTPRKVGAVLTSFGFAHRDRLSTAWLVLLDEPDQQRVHELARIYGMDSLMMSLIRVDLRECLLCDPGRRRLRNYESGKEPLFGSGEHCEHGAQEISDPRPEEPQ